MHGAAIVKSVYTGLEQVVVAASCVDVQVSDAATPGQSRQSTAQVLRLLTETHTPSELDELVCAIYTHRNHAMSSAGMRRPTATAGRLELCPRHLAFELMADCPAEPDSG